MGVPYQALAESGHRVLLISRVRERPKAPYRSSLIHPEGCHFQMKQFEGLLVKDLQPTVTWPSAPRSTCSCERPADQEGACRH